MDALKRLKDWSAEEGAELVEFALTFPLLLLVTMGIIDFGLLFQRYEVLTNASREGARISVLPGYGAADIEARVNQYLQGTSLSAATVTTTSAPPRRCRSASAAPA
jgi:Flp pilus assembly protein TadG